MYIIFNDLRDSSRPQDGKTIEYLNGNNWKVLANTIMNPVKIKGDIFGNAFVVDTQGNVHYSIEAETFLTTLYKYAIDVTCNLKGEMFMLNSYGQIQKMDLNRMEKVFLTNP